MTVRDNVLPALNRARAIIERLGFRRTAVTIRRRTWAGTRVGDTAGQNPGYTDVNTVLTPTPKVALMSPFAAQMAGIMTSAGNNEDRYFEISGITPSFVDPTDGLTKGYTPAQLKQLVTAGALNQQIDFMLTGDDGVARPTTLVLQDFTKPFGYKLTVRLQFRDV